MTQEYFFDLSGDIYMQIEGVAMGSKIIQLSAHWENNIFI